MTPSKGERLGPRTVRRFAWTSSHDAGWTQLPLAPRPIAWLTPLAGLAAAMVGGCLLGWAADAPWKTRAALVIVGVAVVAAIWFHLHQLSRRRLPSSTLWPATLLVFFGLGPFNFLLEWPTPPLAGTNFVVEDMDGERIDVPLGSKARVASLWRRLMALQVELRIPGKPAELLAYEELLSLYGASDVATLQAMSAQELGAKLDADELGLPFFVRTRGPPFGPMRLVRMRVEGLEPDHLRATATATDGRTTIRFKLVRPAPVAGVVAEWRFALGKVEIE